jgi:hypothetical protein
MGKRQSQVVIAEARSNEPDSVRSDVQVMMPTINRVKHLGAVLNELVAIDEND